MARRPPREPLYDVSLFEQSPTDDSHFNLTRSASTSATMFGPRINISSWDEIPEEFRPLPPNVGKPLPPLPSPQSESPRTERTIGPPRKSRSDDTPRRNFWFRMRRSKSESHHETCRDRDREPLRIQTYPERLLPPRHPEDPPFQSRMIASSQLVWVPEAQMWLVTDGGETPTVTMGPLAQSSSTAQDVSFYHPQPRTYQPWRPPLPVPDATLSPFDPPPSYYSENWVGPSLRSPRETQWDFMARRMQRPSSAGP